MSQASTTHHEAEIAREIDRDFPAALAAADRAMVAYSEEGNHYGVAEALCSRVIALRHMSDALGNKAFFIQAHHDAQAAVEIAEEGGVSTAIMYLNLAKIQRAMGELDKAVESFRKAVEGQKTNPHETQNRPGVLANMEELLATTELEAGDDSALVRAEKALADLKAADEDPYNKSVWLSHGHMRIAHALKDRNRELAERHLGIAREMIRGNDALVLTQGKLEKLEAMFNEGKA